MPLAVALGRQCDRRALATEAPRQWHSTPLQIADTLRRRVEFHRHNLLDSFLRLAPPLDIVFLRNVLIYFELSTKTEVFQRLRQSMTPDGILVLGETESTLGITTDFQLNDACRDFYQPEV